VWQHGWVTKLEEVAAMELHSESFSNESPIQDVYTCDGKERSPHLAWSGAPRGTMSYAIIVDDPDAPGGTFAHWGVCNLPPELTHVDEGFSSEDADELGALQAMNDFGRRGYGGPCPPKGHGLHHYRFQVLALDVPRLDIPSRASVRDLEEAAHPHILNRARLTGIYERK
jgi:Raf kinase inhibitor-like YbhB/YbcL family protein